MATVYDIVKGLAQAAANAYDGAQYEKYAADGKARKIGLKREEGDAVLDSRVIDGFKVRFVGPKLIITYLTELSLKEYHNSKLDEEIERVYKDIVKFLKKDDIFKKKDIDDSNRIDFYETYSDAGIYNKEAYLQDRPIYDEFIKDYNIEPDNNNFNQKCLN